MNYNLKDFRIDQLVDLYLKGAKDLQCYSTPSKKNAVWFKKEKGQILGKLFSWVENQEGVFMMFKIGDNYDKVGLYTSYYIPLESKIIDWNHVKPQLDARRRENMTFYDKWFDDLETALEDYEKKLLAGVKDGLLWGGVIVGGVILWKVYFQPMIQAKIYANIIKTAVKEYKR